MQRAWAVSAVNAVTGADLLGGRRNCQSARYGEVVGDLEAAGCGTRQEAMCWHWLAGMGFVSNLPSRGFTRECWRRGRSENREGSVAIKGHQVGQRGNPERRHLRPPSAGERGNSEWRVIRRVFEFMTWRDPRRRAGCPRNGQEQGGRNRVVSGCERV